MANSSKDLIPSEKEIKEIMAQAMATDPMQVPIVLLQLHFARLMFKVVDKLRSDLDESIKELENQIDEESRK